MLRPKFGDQPVTKDEARQLNDEMDLRHTIDRRLDQEFAAAVAAYEENPDLSFLRPKLEDQGHLVEKQDGTKKWVQFRALSPLDGAQVEQECPRPDYDDDNDDDEEFIPPTVNPGNPIESEILFEIKKNTELLLIFSQRQREAQERLANAYQQRDHDKLDNPRIKIFTKELEDLIIPIQCLSVALGALNINLKLVQQNDIRRNLVAQPNHAVNNAGTVPFLEPVDRESVLAYKK